MPESDSQTGKQLGARLRAALTDEQLSTLLDVAGGTGVLRSLDGALRAADRDLADAVSKILAPDEPADSSTTDVETSDRRALEIWHEHWAAWEGHVAELGDEQGAYANHDEHWHPPYFDPSALAEDLDGVAMKLAPGLNRAFALVADPGLFDEALAEIDRGIDGYPDWVQMNEDMCTLGPHATTCALRWIWLGLAAKPAAGGLFVERLWKLENEYEHVTWNAEAAGRFFAGLPEEAGREIHTRLGAPPFVEVSDEVRSLWHRVRVIYEQRFDPVAHLRTCDEHLERDWRYGEPLISAATARSDFAAAEWQVARTVSSLLRYNVGEPWQPEEPLWEAKRYGRMPEEERALLDLLRRWEAIAEAGGSRARAASCRLQQALWTSADDWPAVFAAFADFRSRGGEAAVGEKLFGAWRAWEVDACTPSGEPPAGQQAESWVRWLIDARHDPTSRRFGLGEHLEAWIEGCRAHVAFFGRHWRSLALLTRSLPQHEQIKSEYSAFATHVLLTQNLPGKCAQSVREALASLELAGIAPMPAWTEHLHTLVLSPANSSALYTAQAGWMKALSEVNRPRYEALLARWRTEFSRRRNLWKDMKTCGCPGC
jgi:hypothetical protein